MADHKHPGPDHWGTEGAARHAMENPLPAPPPQGDVREPLARFGAALLEAEAAEAAFEVARQDRKISVSAWEAVTARCRAAKKAVGDASVDVALMAKSFARSTPIPREPRDAE